MEGIGPASPTSAQEIGRGRYPGSRASRIGVEIAQEKRHTVSISPTFVSPVNQVQLANSTKLRIPVGSWTGWRSAMWNRMPVALSNFVPKKRSLFNILSTAVSSSTAVRAIRLALYLMSL